MSGRKNLVILFGFVAAVSLISSAVTVMLISCYYSRLQFDLVNVICGEVLEQEPEMKHIVSAALKEYTGGNADGVAMGDVLSVLGYDISDFSDSSVTYDIMFAITGFLAGIVLFAITYTFRNNTEAKRIEELSDYLEQVNMGKAVVLSVSGEDLFSKLEDEIYKTVTFLYQTKDAAVQAKNDFAENLSNIAHQIKTPITAISLSLQTLSEMPMKKEYEKDRIEQIKKQLNRLIHLEESLLVLSRLDAGALMFQKEDVDVFTLLVLAADNLQELFADSGTFIDIPESGEMAVTADLNWTMEAVINVMKNCMEHNAGGTVHCSYGQNPLYTEILIWDEGDGFAKEDIPHLFKRFYRGKNADAGGNIRGSGIGIGLALSKEIIEHQNGTIRAKNLPNGGACFEIRLYKQ
ncbi:HAMP domain-containing histidine kinase [Petralouisia muris]|uniref:HAMP domain-containing histidine kinase n=1 Tax=Petralouisia muris TaxID=3032872 RepID=A0AC61RR06_9FIRM|nr:HAMP domain-containing sensor histidine kinase [Petralouisia muris]TGY91299.1 HAMP domain-containing histidine kinase [Petralouisia muris]